jgi:hypothetical protein
LEKQNVHTAYAPQLQKPKKRECKIGIDENSNIGGNEDAEDSQKAQALQSVSEKSEHRRERM